MALLETFMRERREGLKQIAKGTTMGDLAVDFAALQRMKSGPSSGASRHPLTSSGARGNDGEAIP